MFRLMRWGFQARCRLQPQSLLQLPRRGAASPLAPPPQRALSLAPKSQLLRQASAWATEAQGFHSSSCCLKKRPPEEPPLRLPGSFSESARHLKDSPKPARYLGYAGLIPFVSVPLFMVVQQAYYPQLAFAQVTYGACVLSFLGGVRWGFALPEGSPAKPDWINLANSIVLPLMAWSALLYRENLATGAAAVVIGLGVALHYDLSLLPTYPPWFKAMRTILTLVAAVSLIATSSFISNFPERDLFENSESPAKSV